jgi:tRNA A37 threonylcarbamoyladenosine dehydratase
MLRDKYTNRFESGKSLSKIYLPQFFCLTNAQQKAALENIIEAHPELQIVDEIQSQLREYIKLQHPAQVLDSSKLEELMKTELGERTYEEFGQWVYYEWSNRLVHILDEKEFVSVRTNRNKYKITEEEQSILSTKKVGIIGLSVGQSVALTMAMERGFGELRLADFDDLELTNFNRIRTGLHNLGSSKTITTAREIAEIDPYLKVSCFTDGIKENNIDSFFMQGGKLDLVIDECDELDIKVLCRVKAKENKVPVVMEMSDRCMIDIERYDLDENLKMFHGGIEHLDISNLKNLTTEQKIPYMLPMVGSDTISDRLKASALEVGSSISSWPQLASAVVMGGGVSADVVRRILLNHFHESGRYFVDLEELISDKKPPEEVCLKTAPELTGEIMSELAEKFLAENKKGEQIEKDEADTMILKAGMAPSYAGTRPWQWYWKDGQLFIFHDKARSAGFYDTHDHSSMLSLGTCCENIRVVASASGYALSFKFHHDALTGINLVYIYFKSADVNTDALLPFIEQRKSFRKLAPAQPMPGNKLEEFSHYASLQKLDLHMISQPDELQKINSLLAEANSIYFLNKYAHKEYYSRHLSFSQERRLTENPFVVPNIHTSEAELAALRMARKQKVNVLLNDWKLGNLYRKLGYKSTFGASAIGIITSVKHDREDFFNQGMAIQNLWLKATQMKFGILPINYITSLQLRAEQDEEKYLETSDFLRIQKLRQDLNQTFNFLSEKYIIFVFKLALNKHKDEAG